MNGAPVPVDAQMLFYPFWGSDQTYPHMAVGWAWAFSTPFKWVKQVASHFGGTRQGMAMAWPNRIKDAGGIRTQFHHVIDVVPTILEATGVAAPETIDGITQDAIEGVSMAYTWDKANAGAPSKHETQYFEILGNRAIYRDGWIAATTPATVPWAMTATVPDVINGYNWELYDVNSDFTEFIFQWDETFDVGMDTGTPVSLIEYHYDVPFPFTGTLNKLTFDLQPQQMTPEEHATQADKGQRNNGASQ